LVASGQEKAPKVLVDNSESANKSVLIVHSSKICLQSTAVGSYPILSLKELPSSLLSPLFSLVLMNSSNAVASANAHAQGDAEKKNPDEQISLPTSIRRRDVPALYDLDIVLDIYITPSNISYCFKIQLGY